MSAPKIAALVCGLDSVGLAELALDAELQTRKDRKYLVPLATIGPLIEQMHEDIRVLEIEGTRAFRYESVYFDTPDLCTYVSAARGRPRRFKVRTRAYMDSGECLLEVKTRERTGLTVKHRLPYPLEDRERLTDEALMFLEEFERIAPVCGDLGRTMTTRYNRTTLLEGSSASRVTIDTDLECIAADGRRVTLPGYVFVETKTETATPSRADRLLWASHYRPKKVSKYCTALAALDPGLPANKWNRVLRTHFAATAPRHPAARAGSRSALAGVGTTSHDHTIGAEHLARATT